MLNPGRIGGWPVQRGGGEGGVDWCRGDGEVGFRDAKGAEDVIAQVM